MRTSIVMFVGLASSVLYACGGGESMPVDARDIDAPDIDAIAIDAVAIDAPVDAAVDAPPFPGVCNPLAPAGQQGCIAGQKCTWIYVQDTPVVLGQLGCVPDGNVALGDACLRGAPGESTGYDDCSAGLICIEGACADICGFDGSSPCAAGYNCTSYANVFANGTDEPVAGVCSPSCDPLTQLRIDGEPCGVGKGCYVLSRTTGTTTVCASAGNVAVGAEIPGSVFANSCVPGAQPRTRAQGSTVVECGGLCRVTDVTSTTNMTSEGGVAPDSCVTRWGAAPPEDTQAGESCRYWWAREPFDGVTPYSNTLGWCFKHTAFLYDTNLDGSADTPFPRCIDLTTGDVVLPIGTPPHNDARYFWCLSLPQSFQGWSSIVRRMHAREPLLDRLGDWR